MILFKSAIREAVFSGLLTIEDDHGSPFTGWESHVLRGTYRSDRMEFVHGKDPIGLQPASVDLHLGSHWKFPLPNCPESFVYEAHTDTRKPVEYLDSHSDSYMIPAHGFVLARTQEVIGLDPDLFGKIDGRSSFGRAGVFVENAGVIDNGFKGSITLELFNALPYPILVHAGTRCCQIMLFRGEGSSEGGYQGGYQGQIGTKGSMLYKTVPGGFREA